MPHNDYGRPLKITARLLTPLAGDPPQLDSLLESVMRHRVYSVRESDRTPIPIVRRTINGRLVPCCSNPILGSVAYDGHIRLARRFPVERAELLDPARRIVVATGTGPLRSYYLPLRIRLVQQIVWFVLGIPKGTSGAAPGKRVRQLLADVTGIGDDTRIGWGRVAEWIVEPWHADWSWYAPGADGRPVVMRTLPAGQELPEDMVGSMPYFDAPCGPYHDASNKCEVLKPC